MRRSPTRPPNLTRLAAPLAGAALMLAPGAATAQTEMGGDATVQPGGTLPGEPAIELVQVASGLADPIDVAADGSGRLFIVERPGTIRIVDTDGQLLEEPFLEIGPKTDFLEQGLLGLAFSPDYADSGRFYVYYNDYSTNGNQRIVGYSVSEG